MTVISCIMISMEKAHIPGQTGGSMLEIGRIIEWKEEVCLLGVMEESTMGSTKMIKNMDMVFLNGQMVRLFVY